MKKNTPQIDNNSAELSVRALKRNALREAYETVPPHDRTRAFTMLGACGVTMVVLFLSRLFWLLKPLLDTVYYGRLTEILYYLLLGALCTVYIIVLNKYVKQHCEDRIFLPSKQKMTISRVLIIIAIGAATAFITAAAFGFKLKLEFEMGSGVTFARLLTNVLVYFYYAFHLWLGLTAATLFHKGMTVLFPVKYNIPWGAIFLVTAFGICELILEMCTTTHMYPWIYYLYTYIYAAVLMLSDNRFHVTYWASVIIMVL